MNKRKRSESKKKEDNSFEEFSKRWLTRVTRPLVETVDLRMQVHHGIEEAVEHLSEGLCHYLYVLWKHYENGGSYHEMPYSSPTEMDNLWHILMMHPQIYNHFWFKSPWESGIFLPHYLRPRSDEERRERVDSFMKDFPEHFGKEPTIIWKILVAKEAPGIHGPITVMVRQPSHAFKAMKIPDNLTIDTLYTIVAGRFFCKREEIHLWHEKKNLDLNKSLQDYNFGDSVIFDMIIKS